jgi:hypothetical protein
MAEEAEASTLEFTPTWIVAAVCSLIVLISLLAERCLHYLGKVNHLPPPRALPFRIPSFAITASSSPCTSVFVN